MCRVGTEKGRVISAVLALWAKWTKPDFGCVQSQLCQSQNWPSRQNPSHLILGSSLSVKPWPMKKQYPKHVFGPSLMGIQRTGAHLGQVHFSNRGFKKISVLTHKVTIWKWVRRVTGVPVVGWELEDTADGQNKLKAWIGGRVFKVKFMTGLLLPELFANS